MSRNRKKLNNKKSDQQNDRSMPRRNAKGPRDRKFDRKDELPHADSDGKSPTNDFPWYNKIPQLTGDATKIQYSWPTGKPFALGKVNSAAYKLVAPGVQVEYLVPAYGFTSTIDDSINVMAQQMYAYLRKDQTSSAVFDRQDAMIYEFAVAEMFSYLEFLRRIYGLASRASVDNSYIPNGLISAMGVSPTSIVDNLADFRYGINLLIQKTSQFAIPNEMTLFSRKVFLYSGLYSEGTSIKDQLYMYSPVAFYYYGNNAETKAGELVYTEFFNPVPQNYTLKSYQDLLTYGKLMIAALMNAGDVSFVSGAIVKTFGTNLITLNLLPEEYFVAPTFDITVLEQMKNATVIPYNGYNKPNLEQNPGSATLLFQPEWDSTRQFGSSGNAGFQQLASNTYQLMQLKKILQTTTNEVTPAVTMENSRLMVVAAADDTSIANTTLNLYCGTEICVGVAYVRHSTNDTDPSGTLYTGPISSHVNCNAIVSEGTNAYNTSFSSDGLSMPWFFRLMEKRNAFDFAPPMYELVTFINGEAGTEVVTNGMWWYLHDLDNYAVIDDMDLMRLHEAAIISLVDMRLYNTL